MSTLVTIQPTDLITNSRADINGNFAALNTDKIETSVIDTDSALTANSDSKVATQKAVKAYVDAQTLLSIATATTSGATASLTTTATQRVVVFAKGNAGESGTKTITLKYNGVTKDTLSLVGTSTGEKNPFMLMYTETPGAATANITVVTDAGTLENVVIMAIKI